MKKDGTQLEKRSTAAVGAVATSAAMSIPIPSMAAISSNNSKDKEGHEKKQKEKEAPARNPCWVGLDNGACFVGGTASTVVIHFNNYNKLTDWQ